MDFRQIAISLIQAVGGIECDKNIDGVVQVFNGIMNGVHNQWTEHLSAEASDYLMYNELLCKCGRLFEVKLNTDIVNSKKN